MELKFECEANEEQEMRHQDDLAVGKTLSADGPTRSP